MTAEESRRQHIEKMGEPLGVQFAELWQEVAYLHLKWLEYVELYGSKPTRLQLLNQAAPGFFGMLQRVLWEDILLHLARLTDPPRSGGRNENLTVRNLPSLIDNPGLKRALEELIEQLSEATDFCRNLRNRHIAHRDLDLALRPPSAPLKAGSRKQVNEALKILSDILNMVQLPYEETQTYFRVGRTSGGAVSLLYTIALGNKAQERRREQLLRGDEPEDSLPAEV